MSDARAHKLLGFALSEGVLVEGLQQAIYDHLLDVAPEFLPPDDERDWEEWAAWMGPLAEAGGFPRSGNVTVRKNERGSWSVYADGRIVSDHATRDGAATAANNLIRAGGSR